MTEPWAADPDAWKDDPYREGEIAGSCAWRGCDPERAVQRFRVMVAFRESVEEFNASLTRLTAALDAFSEAIRETE